MSVRADLQLPMYWSGLINSVVVKCIFRFFPSREILLTLFSMHLAVNFVRCDFLAEKVRFRKFLQASRAHEKKSAGGSTYIRLSFSISQKPRLPTTLDAVLCTLPMAVQALSVFLPATTMRCIKPILTVPWMTLCFHITWHKLKKLLAV